MPIANSLIADSESFRGMADGTQILSFVEDRFRSFGATHFLATGLPMPGRSIEPLILRLNWGEGRGEKPQIDPADPLLQQLLRAHRSFFWFENRDRGAAESPLCAMVGPPGEIRVIGVPVCAFLPYQACVVAAGTNLTLDLRAALAIDHFCTEAFRRLFALGYLNRDRPGDLSARERRVVELSAFGNTANEIASVLQISQRTVHAHLQNASEKLRASNKTHTVVEALIYGQISV
jgi:LuxR family transcriptional regulator, quorum-sensing system regulator BjaR1